MGNDGVLTLDEAKRVAVLGGEAPVSRVVEALSRLYDEVRRYEVEALERIGAAGPLKQSEELPAYRAAAKESPWRPGEK